MRGLAKNGVGYAVVRANSTAGRWVVERTTKNTLKQTQADIASVWTTHREADQEAKKLNR